MLPGCTRRSKSFHQMVPATADNRTRPSGSSRRPLQIFLYGGGNSARNRSPLRGWTASRVVPNCIGRRSAVPLGIAPRRGASAIDLPDTKGGARSSEFSHRRPSLCSDSRLSAVATDPHPHVMPSRRPRQDFPTIFRQSAWSGVRRERSPRPRSAGRVVPAGDRWSAVRTERPWPLAVSFRLLKVYTTGCVRLAAFTDVN